MMPGTLKEVQKVRVTIEGIRFAGEAIDIAVTTDDHSSVFGLASNSAFLILGDGDLSEDFAQLYISPKIFARITTAQALRMLLQRSNDFIYLSPAVEAKIKNLESEGWKSAQDTP